MSYTSSTQQKVELTHEVTCLCVSLQVVPALDPDTPIYSGGFAMQLIKRRMQEYSLWNESRFKTFKMNERFQLGPFE